MENHLLVSVSEQKSALYGVQFVGSFFRDKSDVKLTLFYTAPKPPPLYLGERTVEIEKERELQARQFIAKGNKALQTARNELINLGFVNDRVIAKLQERQLSKVDDIIWEGERGKYDAVVLGRRGLSWLEEAFEDSVSKKFMKKDFCFPIWICRKPEPGRKNVLVCLDGSESSYRIVDHVGFILNQQETHDLTLLAVKTQSLKDKTEEIILGAKERLLKNNITEDRIKIRTPESGNVVKTILNEAEQGRFAAVATGMLGVGRGFVKKAILGSVSFTLFRELEKAALFVCH